MNIYVHNNRHGIILIICTVMPLEDGGLANVDGSTSLIPRPLPLTINVWSRNETMEALAIVCSIIVAHTPNIYGS